MANNVYNDKLGRYEISTITIETVDQTVFDYFDKIVDPHVDTDRSRLKLLCMWATRERWKLIRKNNFRDENGTLILPLLSIKRTDFDFTPNGGLGTQVSSITVESHNHNKSSIVADLIRQRKILGFPNVIPPPIKTVLTIPYPQFCTVMYEISIWSQYEQQMNEVLQQILGKYDFNRVSEFVMPVAYNQNTKKGNGYYFVGFRDNNITPQGNAEDLTDQERIIKYTYQIKVPAYLILDSKDNALSYGKDFGDKGSTGKNVVYEQQTQNRIVFQENTLTLEQFEKMFGK